jgi:hypothetical protein
MAKQRDKVPVVVVQTPSQIEAPTQKHTEEIAQLAYSLWQARGCPHGSAEEDWFAAEREKILADSPCGRTG